MTREELLSNNHRQSLIKDFGRSRCIGTPIFCTKVAWRRKRETGHDYTAPARIEAMFPDGRCPTPASSVEQVSGNWRIDDTREAQAIALSV